MQAFEWDETKRAINLEKHGIDFVDAIEVFNDPNRIELEVVRNNETRYQTMGCINHMVFLVVYVSRKKVKRIISARRASKSERETYFNT